MSDEWDDINLSIHNAIVSMGTFQTPLDSALVGITLGEWQLERVRRIRQVMEQRIADLSAERDAAVTRLAWYAQFDAQLNPPWAGEGE